MDTQQARGGTYPENVLYYFAGCLGVIVLTFLCVRSAEAPKDIEEERGNRRIEIRKKIAAEEKSKSELAWVSKDKALARVPVSVARDLVHSDLSAKKVAPSAVKRDPVLVLPPDAPALPSAPSGVMGTQFPSFDSRKQ